MPARPEIQVLPSDVTAGVAPVNTDTDGPSRLPEAEMQVGAALTAVAVAAVNLSREDTPVGQRNRDA